jgi:hypothetical protein
MSEYERPTAVSKDEQPVAPISTASAPSPVPEPADEPVDETTAGRDRDVDATTSGEPGDDIGPQAADQDSPVAEASTVEPRTVEPSTVADPADEAAEPDPAAASDQRTADGRPAWLRPRNLALTGVGVLALVLGAVVGPIAWDAWKDKSVPIAIPPRVAGLVLDDSQGAHETIDYLRTAVQTGVALDKSTGAVYADEAGQSRSVLFVGGSGSIASPEDALTKTFHLISDDAGGVESVQAVPAGPQGGVMKCGSTKTDGGSMAVCGWADHGSLGIAMFPNRPVDQSAELLRTMRKAIQNVR